MEPNSNEELILPCGCDEAFKYSHRSCLNSFHSNMDDQISFNTCILCGIDYTFKKESKSLTFLIIKWIFRFIIQILLTSLIVVIIFLISGILPYAIDTYEIDIIGTYNEINCEWEHLFYDSYFIIKDFVYGFILYCIIFEIYWFIGSMIVCVMDKKIKKSKNDFHFSYIDTERIYSCYCICTCCNQYF